MIQATIMIFVTEGYCYKTKPICFVFLLVFLLVCHDMFNNSACMFCQILSAI